MDVYSKIATKIVEQQETIIGPVAIEQAQLVRGLDINWDKHSVAVQGEGKKVIDALVGQYSELFGQVSVEVCKEAASSFVGELSSDQLPETLK